MLEHYRESRRGAVVTSGLVFLAIVGQVSLLKGLSWTGIWWLWLVALFFPVSLYFGIRSAHWSAGADWLQEGRRWVATYELTTIRGRVNAGSADLELTDAHGHKMTVKLDDVQQNRELWDLVYNGIRHSITVGGADVDRLARGWLQLNSLGRARDSGTSRGRGRRVAATRERPPAAE